MAYEDCLRIIREAAQTDLSDDDIAEIVEELQSRLDAVKATGELRSLEDRLFDEADAFAG